MVETDKKPDMAYDPLDMNNYRIEKLPKMQKSSFEKWMAICGGPLAILSFILFNWVIKIDFLPTPAERSMLAIFIAGLIFQSKTMRTLLFVPIDHISPDGRISTVKVQKIYYINAVFQLCHGENAEYRHFRILMTRNGILKVEEI